MRNWVYLSQFPVKTSIDEIIKQTDQRYHCGVLRPAIWREMSIKGYATAFYSFPRTEVAALHMPSMAKGHVKPISIDAGRYFNFGRQRQKGALSSRNPSDILIT
jgi:hypothetical protein